MEVAEEEDRNKALDKRDQTWQAESHGIWRSTASSSRPDIPLVKSEEEPVPEPTGPKWVLKANKDSRVTIDYHNCLKVHGQVSPKNLAALQGLAANGYQVFLISFAGRDREEEVREDLTKIPFTFTGVHFTRSRCGPKGKGAWCKQMGIGHIFDDNQSICRECQQLGLEPWPIMSRWENHPWADRRYGCLWKAVEDFLVLQALKD